LANVGGSAKVAGLSFQETVQTMALIAPSFSSAADAGTSMKTFLQRLIPTTKDATEMMIKLGLATKDGKSRFFDAKGEFIGMEKAAKLLHDATKNLSDEQKFLALNTIFGADAIRAAAAIADAGAEGYNEMGQAMKDAGGAAAAAAIMQQGYSFTLDQFNAAVETLQITVGSALLPHLTHLVSAAAEGVNAFTAWASGILNAADPVAALAAQIGLVGVTTGSVQQMITDAAAVISEVWNVHSADILAFTQQTWDGIMSVVTAAARFVQAAIEALVAAAQWIWANFGNEITTIAQFAWSLIKTLTETALAVLRGLFEAGTAALRGDWSAAWEAIKGVAEALWNGIKASAEHLMNTLSSLFQTLYPRLEAAFRQALAAAPSLGAALIDGIRSGVESAARGLAQAAANAAKAALDAAKAALGIRSPSRVAAKEVGVPLAEGILRGLTEGLAPLPLLTRDAVTQPPPASSTVNVGGITVNAAPGMDERRIALMVRSEIDNLTRFARFGRV
jgi:hypothetical protein